MYPAHGLKVKLFLPIALVITTEKNFEKNYIILMGKRSNRVINNVLRY